MAMNRETKRMLQRQGQLGEDGAPAAKRERRAPTAPRPTDREQRTKPTEFVREVRTELRKVAWPTRAETINYATVVLLSLVVLIILIFALDYAFGKASLFLFK